MGEGEMKENLLPSKNEIFEILKQAEKKAEIQTMTLGMLQPNFNICDTGLKTSNEKNEEESEDSNEEEVIDKINEENLEENIDSEMEEEIKEEVNHLNLDDIDFKDYTNTKTKNKSAFLSVILKNGKIKTVKKSTLVWLFSEKKGRISSDRIMRVRGTITSSKKKSKTAYSMNKNTTKISTLKNIKKTSKKTKSTINNDLEEMTDEFSDESSSEYSNISDSSGSDLDSDLDIEEEQKIDEEEESKDLTIKVEKEGYYAVFYDNRWYIGRILEKKGNTCRVKFLQEDLNEFIWPKNEIIEEIDMKYIFYGPISLINLEGVRPFAIKRYDRNKINSIYKEWKKR